MGRGGGAGDTSPWLALALDTMVLERGGCEVLPRRAFGFMTIPAAGAEWAIFGLVRYPRALRLADGRRVATGLTGWQWQAFCKTQYASNPSHGGIGNFQRCHLGVIALLDEAARLGLETDVTDESGYATHRDAVQLVAVVKQWNVMIAGVVGHFKDGLPGKFDAPIAEYPDFEHLEARGRAQNRCRPPE